MGVMSFNNVKINNVYQYYPTLNNQNTFTIILLKTLQDSVKLSSYNRNMLVKLEADRLLDQ